MAHLLLYFTGVFVWGLLALSLGYLFKGARVLLESYNKKGFLCIGISLVILLFIYYGDLYYFMYFPDAQETFGGGLID